MGLPSEKVDYTVSFEWHLVNPLWEPVHSSVGLNVYHSLAVCYFSEFVFNDDFFWYVVDADADELGLFQRCHKGEIRYVYRHESRSLG
jgi:hypothetical protein